ncbi:hypothetical protein ONS95_013146 [Cadophora gregata]|uniref:uncharacterized protein n=1 Tax=Cadophora gregata TaxID=51156 RepID=UPI0026DD2C78|nr:uncharacterized protein ONS95_013146 [Cadophora gregata]KAK0100040.1 hypothetical protein ONS96_007978 [Cadophora gregata f. sp. sojae]KAK0116114.1 hypothetical protein ONS95_013146 [Cadophora gregata]
MNQSGPKSSFEQQASNRACEACRAHKVRCLPNTLGSSKICQRCAKTDRQCIFAAPMRRKQRKRTDTRVAELEREVSAMRALFRQGNDDIPATYTQQASQPDSQNDTPRTGMSYGMRSDAQDQSAESGETPASWSIPTNLTPPVQEDQNPQPFSPESDFIERGLISMEEATKLFKSYNDNLVQHYPAVSLEPTVSAEELRKTKPTLFLATVAAASGKMGSQLYSILNSELLCAYAHRTVIEGQKSLELVQVMIILSVWYFPPGKFAQLKYYEYIHMAATMGLDIGLGTNPQSSRDRRRNSEDDNPLSNYVDSAEIERRRTFLVCYLISTGVSLSSRRPNMLRYSRWVGQCLESLENNPNASQMDKHLVSWIKLMKITEEIGLAFGFEDISYMASLSEPRTQIVMSGLQKTLQSWKVLFGSHVNDAVMIQYHHSQLFLHEIALHDDHPPEDFRPPFNLGKILSIHTMPGAKHSFIDATANLISSAHSMLDIILAMELSVLRSLPVYNFVRMSYSIIILVKLYISSKSPTSKLGEVLDSERLKLGIYLKALIDLLIAAVGPMECRAPYTFLGMLMRFYGWYKSQESSQTFTPPPVDSPAVDQCWLPPMPRVTYELQRKADSSTRDMASSNAVIETKFQSKDSTDHDTAMHNQFDTQDMGEFQYDFGDGLDIDQFMLLGASDTFNPGFNNWLPDMGMAGGIDASQMQAMYDYDCQGGHNSSL